MCQRYKHGALKRICAFSFFNSNFFSIFFGVRTGKREESMVPTRYPKQDACIFVFRSKKFSSIFRFLEVAQVKERCQRYQ